MKTILIALVSVLSLQTQARNSSDFKNLLSDAQSNPQKFQSVKDAPQSPVFTPGLMKVRIVKKTFVADGDNSYHFDTKTVCEVQSPLKILDGRTSLDPANIPFAYLNCDSTLNGAPLGVSVGGLMMLENYEIFDNEGKVDLKSAGAFMNYGGSVQDSKNLVRRTSLAATRDLSSKSLVFSLEPEVICLTSALPTTVRNKGESTQFTSAPATCSMNEYFSAVVEFIDLSVK